MSLRGRVAAALDRGLALLAEPRSLHRSVLPEEVRGALERLGAMQGGPALGVFVLFTVFVSLWVWTSAGWVWDAVRLALG